jgi:hypothetical protein
MLQLLLLCAGLLLGASTAHAGTKTACSKALDAVVGRYLDQPHLRSPESKWGKRQEDSRVFQSVCQRHPSKPNLWQVVYVIEKSQATHEDYSVDVLVALIDLQKRQVIASTKELLEPDPMYDEWLSLSFAPPLGLPGPDLQLLRSPTRSPNCAEGYVSNESTVYVARGKKLVPVISNIFLSHEWREGVCGQSEPITVQEIQRGLRKTTSVHHGMPDVHLNVTVRDFDNKTAKLRQTRSTKVLLRYNGQRYESNGDISTLEECGLDPHQAFCKKSPTSQKAKP